MVTQIPVKQSSTQSSTSSFLNPYSNYNLQPQTQTYAEGPRIDSLQQQKPVSLQYPSTVTQSSVANWKPVPQTPSWNSYVSSITPQESNLKPVSQGPRIQSLQQPQASTQKKTTSNYDLGLIAPMSYGRGQVKPESESYIKNKEFEIVEFNRQLANANNKPITTRGPFIEPLEKKRSDLIADLSTRPGVMYNEDEDAYLIPIEPEQYENGYYNDMVIKNFDGSGTRVSFVPEAGRLQQPKDPIDVNSFFSKSPLDIFTFSRKERDAGIDKSREFVQNIDTSTPDIPVDGTYTDAGKLYEAKVNALLPEYEAYDTRLSNFEQSQTDLMNSVEVANINKAQQDLQLLSLRNYRDYWGTTSDMGTFGKDGSIIEIGPAMPEADRLSILNLTNSISENFNIVNPKFEALDKTASDINYQQFKLEEKSNRLNEAYDEANLANKKIANLDPVKLGEYVLTEREKAYGTSVPGIAGRFALGVGKTVAIDPVRFFGSVADIAESDVKNRGRIPTESIIGGAPVMAARAIYDWRAEKGKRFDADALSGAISIGTFGYSALAKATVPVATNAAKEVVKQVAPSIGKRIAKVAGLSALYSIPASVEAFNYATTPAYVDTRTGAELTTKEYEAIPEQDRAMIERTRYGAVNIGRAAEGYGQLFGLIAGGKAAGEIGTGLRTAKINAELRKNFWNMLEKGEIKIKVIEKTTKGTVNYKDMDPGLGATAKSELLRNGKIYMETPYGNFQFKADTITSKITGNPGYSRTSQKVPLTSNKILNRKITEELTKKYNDVTGYEISTADFDKFLKSSSYKQSHKIAKSIYDKYYPEIRDFYYKGAPGQTPSGTMTSDSTTVIKVRQLDNTGKAISKYKDLAVADQQMSETFFKNPNFMLNVIQGKSLLLPVEGTKGGGLTLVSSKGKYYVSPVSTRTSVLTKDIDPLDPYFKNINTANIEKAVFSQGTYKIGKPVEVSKELFKGIANARGDPGKIRELVGPGIWDDIITFYTKGGGKNALTFSNSQFVQVLKTRPDTIFPNKFYYIGKTDDVLKSGIRAGTKIIPGKNIDVAKLKPNSVVYEVLSSDVGTVTNKGVTNYVLNRNVGPQLIFERLGTPTKSFTGYSQTVLGKDAGINVFGGKPGTVGSITGVDKYAGRPSNPSMENLYNNIDRIKINNMKTELINSKLYPQETVNEILSRFKEPGVINPATGMIAVTPARRAELQAIFHGVWDKNKLIVGPRINPVKVDYQYMKTFDPMDAKLITTKGGTNLVKKDIIGMNTLFTVFENQPIIDTVVGSAKPITSGSTAVLRIFDSRVSSANTALYNPIALTESSAVLSTIMSAPPTVVAGSGAVIQSPILASANAITRSFGNQELSNTALKSLSSELLGTSAINKLENTNTPIYSQPVVNQELIFDPITTTKTGLLTDPVASTYMPQSLIQTPATAITQLTSTPTETITTTYQPTDVLPPLVQPPTIIWPSPPPAFWPPPGSSGSGNRRNTMGRMNAFTDPLADWRIFFKRQFGFLGLPGVTKTVNVFNPLYKDGSDVGNFEKKLKLLLS